MNLIGGRAALKLNVCAVIVALIVSVEGAYIDDRVLGRLRISELLFSFVPVIAMFLVRNKIFSVVFLSLYVALVIQMVFQASSLHSGTYEGAGAKDPLGYLGLFVVLSLVSVAIYGAGVLVYAFTLVCAHIPGRLKR